MPNKFLKEKIQAPHREDKVLSPVNNKPLIDSIQNIVPVLDSAMLKHSDSDISTSRLIINIP